MLVPHTSTTGVPAISRPTTSLKAIQVVVPPRAVTERFNELVQPLFLQYDQNVRQIPTAGTRCDTQQQKVIERKKLFCRTRGR